MKNGLSPAQAEISSGPYRIEQDSVYDVQDDLLFTLPHKISTASDDSRHNAFR